jgi:hypothetical protein
MARIVIKDLKESVELDREAMRQITGGQSRQHLNLKGVHTYESTLFQKSTAFDHLFDFDLNKQ